MQTTYALYGVKLNVQSAFVQMNTRTEMLAPLINCVIDNGLLKTMSDIDQALQLQFIDVINLIDLFIGVARGCSGCTCTPQGGEKNFQA